MNTMQLPSQTGRLGLSLVLRVAPWLIAASLLLANIATLLNERFHTAAFNALSAVASVAGPAVAEALLARSPSNAKARAVTGATRQLQLERDDLHRRIHSLQSEYVAVKSNRDSLVKEHAALRATAAKRAEAVRKVASRSTAVLASRSAEALTSFPVRAAPYVGIAALVTFTTIELKADCELAKSLAELSVEHGIYSIDTGQVCGAVQRVPSPSQAWASVKAQTSATMTTVLESIEGAASKFGYTLYSQPLRSPTTRAAP